MNDKVGDFITRIRNGGMAKLKIVTVPNTKLNRNILDVLMQEGYIQTYKVHNTSNQIEKKQISKIIPKLVSVNKISLNNVKTFLYNLPNSKSKVLYKYKDQDHIKCTPSFKYVPDKAVNLIKYSKPSSNEFIQIFLKYDTKISSFNKPVISSITRISKPSRRIYLTKASIPTYNNGLGTYIISTSKGIMTSQDAILNNVGGEVLFSIF